MKLKNKDIGPRGFYADGAAIVLNPGETSDDVSLSEDELAAAKRSDWFEISGRATKAGDKD